MSVEFAVGAASPSQFPRDDLPEVAFVGRSNVGKSSLLNTLLLRGKKSRSTPVRKQLAHVSATPGRTQSINFYRVNGEMYFVDLPGYGFAKAPKKVMDAWRRLAETYLTGREPLRLVVLIVDARHGPTDLDRQMAEWLEANEQPFVVVASKADKLKKAQLARAVHSIAEDFCPPLAFSSTSGLGVSTLWGAIRSALEA